MYHRILHVGMFGVSEEIADAIRAQQAPEDFEYEFALHDEATEPALSACDVAIITLAAAEKPGLESVHSLVFGDGLGFHAVILVAAEDAVADWTQADFENVDAIWPEPLSHARAAYEFNRMARQAKQEADAYITSTYLDTLIDSMPEMVWFKRLDGAHMKVNSYFCDIVDKPREDVTGQYHNYIWNVPPEDQDKAELTCKISEDAAIECGHTCQFEENVSTHGEIRLFATYKTPIYDIDGSVLGTSGFAHDVTTERELQQLAWLNARTDYLTGMFNRRYFSEYMEEHADEGPFTFVMLDLDNFKDVNDTWGHNAGDSVLKFISDIMKKYFEDCPIIRWGGDEFIIIVPASHADLATEDRFNAMVNEIKERTSNAAGIALTMSGGISRNVTSDSADEAIIEADRALYQAKHSGKSCLIIAGA